jgi:hypothetical protein
MLDPVMPLLAWAAAVHAALAVLCLPLLAVEAAPLQGAHPALKPLKFAISIAVFLLTLGVLLPMLSVSPAMRLALAWAFAGTMAVEMLAIGAQAMRGRTSHFNVEGPLDQVLWRLMLGAIVLMTAAWVALVGLTTALPLVGPDGPREPSHALAWRAGVWLFLFAPVTGFAMGGRGRHAVGGDEASAGLPLVRWSTTHGDLRAAHFFAVHSLQVLPLAAWGLTRLGLGPTLGAAAMAGVGLGTAALCAGTLRQALAGQPLLGRRARPGAP